MKNSFPTLFNLSVRHLEESSAYRRTSKNASKSASKRRLPTPIPELAITAVVACILYYFFLPAINLKSPGFWVFILVVDILFALLIAVREDDRSDKIFAGAVIIAMVILGIMVIAFLGSCKIFRARSLANVLKVEEGTLEDLPDVGSTDSIALMDTESSRKLGDREVGSLIDIINQYEVSDEYMQINLNGQPMKVSPLEFASFFKWHQDAGMLFWKKPVEEQQGIPGYVNVHPYKMDAAFTRTAEDGMIYVPSAYFRQDLHRHLRLQFPGLLLGKSHFEPDEEGKRWYVTPVHDHTVGLFGGDTVIGAIITDPATPNGESVYYSVSDIPEWVDVVFDGDLILKQYNWYGMLQNGLLNSLFKQRGCREATDDYGYISKGSDIWVYTGITSVNKDSSNIGFLLACERTGEARFVQLPGCNESSAMSAAEGEVSEKGYLASFPSLVRMDNIPTYIMVLKDDGGLVKRYSCVNVEQYNIVATASTQKECIEKYKKLCSGDISADEAISDELDDIDMIPDDSWEAIPFMIARRAEVVVDGNTWLYIADTAGNVYRAKYQDVIGLMLVDDGTEIQIEVNGEYFRIS